MKSSKLQYLVAAAKTHITVAQCADSRMPALHSKN